MGGDGGHPTVWGVGDRIQGGHIEPGNLGGLLEELRLGPPLPLGFAVELDHLHGDVFPLAERDDIHEGGQGLWVIHAGAAGDHQRGQAGAVLAAQGNPSQVQHVEYIGVGHLIAQGKADDVKLRDRVTAFQCIEGEPLPSHLGLHIAPRGKDTLAPDPVHLVHHPVEDAHAQVRHADLIGVWKAEGEPTIHGAFVFLDGVVFPAHITARLLYPRQNFL